MREMARVLPEAAPATAVTAKTASTQAKEYAARANKLFTEYAFNPNLG